MAQLYVDRNGAWSPLELTDSIALPNLLSPDPAPRDDHSGLDAPALLRSGDRWFWLSPPRGAIRINGLRERLGLILLRHGDEITGSTIPRLCFSAETLARIAPFPGTPATATCGRCQQTLDEGTPAVQCPGCGFWYHQDEANDLPCFTYTDRCARCEHRTVLGGERSWVPGDAPRSAENLAGATNAGESRAVAS